MSDVTRFCDGSLGSVGIVPLQYSCSSTVPRGGPRRLARSLTTIALHPRRA
jgi:hypothetical protein